MDMDKPNPVLFRLLDPGIVLVVGSMRQGKTAFAFRLCEQIHNIVPSRPIGCYAVDPSRNDYISSLLPSYFSIRSSLDMRDLPLNSVYVCDEATLWANSKNFKKGEAAEKLANDLATTCQRGQTLIVIIQSLALLQLDYFRMGVSLVVKYINPVSLEFERDRLVRILSSAVYGFSLFDHAVDSKSLFYLITDKGYGYFRNLIPSFWSDALSKAWSLNEI